MSEKGAIQTRNILIDALLASQQGKDLVVLGEGLDLFTVPVPRTLAGKPLAESGIGAQTGLLVIGIQHNGEVLSNPPPTMPLPAQGELAMLGDTEQRHLFAELFE